MNKSKKIALLIMIIGIGLFGYSQYASASKIGVIITQSEILDKNEEQTLNNIELEFNNPSLLLLNSGTTQFVISVDGQTVGSGELEPFVLPPLSRAIATGTYLTDNAKMEPIDDEKTPIVEISGVSRYDVFFTTIDVPFSYYPTENQAREFIHQN